MNYINTTGHKRKSIRLFALMLCLSIVFCACKDEPYSGHTTEIIIPVTDTHGAELTDESGEAVTEKIIVPVEYNIVQADMSVPRYCYSLLNETEKEIYSSIIQAAQKMKPEIEISGNEDDALTAYSSVYYDSSELFYLGDSPSFKDGVLKLDYTMSTYEAEKLAPQVENAYNEYVKNRITPQMSDFEKVKAAYEYIISINKYASAVYDVYKLGLMTKAVAHAVCSVGPLLDGQSICTGYARATQLLLQQQGIEATLVTGHANNGNHAWILVPLEGEYYFVDTTWGDPTSADGTDNMTYNYLCVTSKELTRSHEIDVPYRIPDCTATKYNYFYYYGLVLSTDDYKTIYNIAANAYLEGKSRISFKVTDEALGYKLYKEITVNHIYVNSDIATQAAAENPALSTMSISCTFSGTMKIIMLKMG